MSFRGLLVVIPTRNRFELARRAIESVLGQPAPGVKVLISDNSTDDQQRRHLAAYCQGLPQDRVKYVSPATPLPMAEHWDWAMGQAVVDASASHIAYLQDRAVFKMGAVKSLVGAISRFPVDIVSVNRDYLDDSGRPVRLVLSDWTGRIFRIKSSYLLGLTARAFHPPQLPDILNAVVPLDLIFRIREVFGNFFASVSPDYCFAYRSLALVDSVIYFDSPIKVTYASDRSNGLAYARGQHSADSADFAAQLTSPRNFAAPIPTLHGITNAVIHEYCLVRDVVKDARFPPVAMPAYLGEIDFGLRHLVNHEIRAANRRLLREHGWGPRQRAVFVATKCFETLLHDPRWVIERLTVRQLAGADWAMPIWRWLNRRGVSWTPGGLRLFDSPEEGLAFALRHSRTRARQLGSLRRRRITRESGQEVLAAANGQHATEPTADGSRASSTASAQHQAK